MATDLILSDLGTQERSILRNLLSDDDSSVELDPAQLNPDQLWDALTMCGRVFSSLQKAGGKVKPILGKLLHAVSMNPEIVQAHGYRSFSDFMWHGTEKIGICPQEAFQVMRIHRVFGDLVSTEHYDRKKIGVAKLELAAKIAEDNKKMRAAPRSPREQEQYLAKLLEDAETLTVAELKSYACEVSGREDGEMDYAVLSIPCTKAFKARWDEFCADSHVLTWAGATTPAGVLEACMMEASGVCFHEAQQFFKHVDAQAVA